MSKQCGKLHGIIKSAGTLAGTMAGRGILVGSVVMPKSVVAPWYDGSYEVEPKVEESVVLSTKGKRMRENVVVDPIEITRVSNTAGGTTVYIGGIINA